MKRFFTGLVISLFFTTVLCGQKIEKTKISLTEIEKSALKVANQQLTAYNNRDIDAFADAYSDSIKIYTFPDKLNYVGKETLRKRYGDMFERCPNLHCTLVSETVKGNKVIHEESVIFDDPEKPVHAVAIYIVENGKITAAYFL